MPSAEARAAFHEAQDLAAQLREAHDREHAIMEMLKTPLAPLAAEAAEDELNRVRQHWSALMVKYNDAIAKYTAAVEAARRPNA